MKVIYVANARIPTEKAHGIQIMKMCEAFALSGHDVELVVPRRSNSIHEDAFEYYKVMKNFSITYLPCLDWVRWGTIGFLVQSFTFAVRSFLYLFRSRPDFIYGRDEISLALLSYVKKNVAWEAHTGQYNFFVRLLVHRRNCTLVTISQGLKDFYVTKGVPAQVIVVAKDAVDLDAFTVTVTKAESRQRLGLPQEKTVVMYIGKLDLGKGLATVLALPQYLDDRYQVVIIGGEESEVKKLRTQHPNIVFLGYRPYSELSLNQQAADFLLIPNSALDTVSRFYTSPIKLFAHMASGIPIVASDIPSLREVLNENNAFFFPPDNPQALARTIATVLKEPEEAHRRATQAAHDVEKYTWRCRAQVILSFLSV